MVPLQVLPDQVWIRQKNDDIFHIFDQNKVKITLTVPLILILNKSLKKEIMIISTTGLPTKDDTSEMTVRNLYCLFPVNHVTLYTRFFFAKSLN